MIVHSMITQNYTKAMQFWSLPFLPSLTNLPMTQPHSHTVVQELGHLDTHTKLETANTIMLDWDSTSNLPRLVLTSVEGHRRGERITH